MVVTSEDIWTLLKKVSDPEIPVLNVVEMGIVRDVRPYNDGWQVDITPTYSGCPAMDTIEADIKQAFRTAKIPVDVKTVLAPAWTTDWITAEAKGKLESVGIAPPVGSSLDKRTLLGAEVVVCCPLCKSEDTRKVSQFGSTACKALYQCNSCQEPFDYFKCL